jgi:hypothetical protein
MFEVVTQSGALCEERRFRDMPEAVNYAVEKLKAFAGRASVVVKDANGVVFDDAALHRTLAALRV